MQICSPENLQLMGELKPPLKSLPRTIEEVLGGTLDNDLDLFDFHPAFLVQLVAHALNHLVGQL